MQFTTIIRIYTYCVYVLHHTRIYAIRVAMVHTIRVYAYGTTIRVWYGLFYYTRIVEYYYYCFTAGTTE